MSLSKEKIRCVTTSRKHVRVKEFQCPLCPKQLANKYNFQKHLQRHSMVGQPFKCDKCGRAYKGKGELTRHFKYLHDENFQSEFECPFCKKPFQGQTQLERHLSIHTKEKHYFCTLCPQEFTTSDARRNHQNTHRSDRQRLFPCPICPMKFFTWRTRHGHIATHTGEKTFKCEECNKCFVQKFELANHSLVHQTERVTFSCPICSKILATKGSLRNHLRTHNPVVFQCSLCTRKLFSNKALHNHIRSHLGERFFDFKCETCGKAFVLLSELTSHQQVHTNADAFKCKECNKQYQSKEGLRRHRCRYTKKTVSPVKNVTESLL